MKPNISGFVDVMSRFWDSHKIRQCIIRLNPIEVMDDTPFRDWPMRLFPDIAMLFDPPNARDLDKNIPVLGPRFSDGNLGIDNREPLLAAVTPVNSMHLPRLNFNGSFHPMASGYYPLAVLATYNLFHALYFTMLQLVRQVVLSVTIRLVDEKVVTLVTGVTTTVTGFPR